MQTLSEMNRIFGFILILLITLSSCSKYQKVLKSSDYDFKYKKAKEYYDKEDYVRALPLFEELITVYRGTTRSEDCFFFYAYCNYGLEDYLLASYHFKNFYKTFPKSERAEQAMFYNAYCYYLDSPRYSLDQSNTLLAINEFQLFLTMYPNSAKVTECNELMDKLRLKLQNKVFDYAKMYYNMGDYKASIMAFSNVIKEYPDSKFCEESQFLILKSQFLLAQNSIETKQKERFEEAIKIYYKFVDYYPNSKYLKEAEQYFDSSKRKLKLEKTNG